MDPSQTKTTKRNVRRAKRRAEQRCQKNGSNVFAMLRDVVQQQRPENRCPSYYDRYGDSWGEWRCSEQYECDFHDTVHLLEVTYVRNPMDVNLLIWSQDGKQLGHSMM